MAACPDGGAQRLSSGGNVTVYLRNAINVPSRGGMMAAAGLKSNPYVKFITRNGVKTSTFVRNTANPVWSHEELNLGVLPSATDITVQLWDKEGALILDAMLGQAVFQVPFCSMFNATSMYYGMDHVCPITPYACASTDSTWAMAQRQLCFESGPIPFGGGSSSSGDCDSGTATCVYVDVKIVPFVVTVETSTIDLTAITYTPVVTVAGPIFPNAPWTSNFGYPFAGFKETPIDTRKTTSGVRNVYGAIMITLADADKYSGAANQVAFYASVNMPATVYVCRNVEDNNNAFPPWLRTYSAANRSVSFLQLQAQPDVTFACYFKYVAGTDKNVWGGVIDNPLPFYTNTVVGHDKGSEPTFYNYNYIVLAVPRQPVPPSQSISVTYDSGAFLTILAQYGLVWAWFMFLSARFLRKQLHFRLDLVAEHLASREKTGDKRSVLIGLFTKYNTTPANKDYRAHLHHASVATWFSVAVPFLLVPAWGGACAGYVKPPALGFLLAFGGFAAVMFWFGYRVWESHRFRMDAQPFIAMAAAVLSFVCFALAAVFQDAGVVGYTFQLNFPAISLVFGAINALPLLFWVSREDQNYKVNFRVAVAKIADFGRSLRVKAAMPLTATASERRHALALDGEKPAALSSNASRALQTLLGACYTLSPHIPLFRMAAVLPDERDTSAIEIVHVDRMQSLSESSKMGPEATGKPLPPGRRKSSLVTAIKADDAAASVATSSAGPLYAVRDKSADVRVSLTPTLDLYTSSLAVLVVYIIVAAVRTAWPSLAFLNCCALALLDLVHAGLARGANKWSPSLKIALLVLGRLVIMSSGASLWIVNYSVAYVVYGLPLLMGVIDQSLPHLSPRQAGEVVFAAKEHLNNVMNPDVAGSETFCFLVLTLAFVSILLVAGLDSQTERLNLLPKYPVPFGGSAWPALTFGVFSVLLVVVGGLLMATFRALHMEHHGLLRGWSRESYLVKRVVNIPRILAAASEVSLLFTGLLIYAITQSNAVLTLFIYVPPALACLLYAYRTWVHQDHRLVVWPPRDVLEAQELAMQRQVAAAAAGDLGAAYGQLGAVFGDHDDDDDDGASDGGGGGGDGEHVEHPESEEDLALVDFPGPGEEGYTSYDDMLPKKARKHVHEKEHILRGFRVPKLEATGFKLGVPVQMPTLPQKSVLRRKRLEMKVAVKGSSAASVEKPKVAFAEEKPKSAAEAGADALRALDKEAEELWGRFDGMAAEADGVDGDFGDARSRRTPGGRSLATGGRPGMRRGFRHHPLVLYLRRVYRGSPALQRTVRVLAFVLRPLYVCLTRTYGCLRRCVVREEAPITDLDSEDGDGDPEGGGAARDLAEPSLLSVPASATGGDAKDPEPDLLHMPFWTAVTYGYLNTAEYTALGAWVGGMALIAAMGVTLGETCVPQWVGYCVWVGCWMLVCTAVPFIEYFATYRVTRQMRQFGYFVALLHVTFCATFFGARLDGDTFIVASLWVLDYFVYYPVFVYVLWAVYSWVDDGCKVAVPPRDRPKTFGDLCSRLVTRTRFYVILGLMVLLCFQFFVWVNPDGVYLGGVIFLLIILTYIGGQSVLGDWARRGYYLHPATIKSGELLLRIAAGLALAFAVCAPFNPTFPLSISFFAALLLQAWPVAVRLSEFTPDTEFFFSPYVLPAYSYDPSSSDVVDEAPLVKGVFKCLLLSVAWGASLAVFLYPVHIGVTVLSTALLATVGLVVAAASYTPVRLGKSAAFINEPAVADAVAHARARFLDRRTPLAFEVYEDNVEELVAAQSAQANQQEGEGVRVRVSSPGKAGQLVALEGSVEGGGSSVSFLSMVPSEVGGTATTGGAREQGSGAKTPPAAAAEPEAEVVDDPDDMSPEAQARRKQREEKQAEEEAAIAAAKKAAEENQPENAQGTGALAIQIATDLIDQHRALTYAPDSTYMVAGKGGGGGGGSDDDGSHGKAAFAGAPWYRRAWRAARDRVARLFEFIPPARLRNFRRHSEAPFSLRDALAEACVTGRGPYGFLGMSGVFPPLLRTIAYIPGLRHLKRTFLDDYDRACVDATTFRLRYHLDVKPIYEKIRLLDTDLDFAYHEEARCAAHFLLMTAASADAKLHHEQILFQKFLFQSRQRLASVGLPLPEGVFSGSSFASINIALVAVWLSTMSEKEKEKFARIKSAFDKEQSERDRAVDMAEAAVLDEERTLVRTRAVHDAQRCAELAGAMKARLDERINAFTDTLFPEDRAIFNMRKDVWLTQPHVTLRGHELDVYERFAQAIFDKDETAAYARSLLAEIEAGQKDCRFGEYGRAYQFVDSGFFPNETSLGDCFAAASVLGWRCAPGINSATELVRGHPDPEEVEDGHFKDGWITSALTMIAAVSKRNVEIAQRNRGVARGAQNLYAPEEQLTPLQLALTNQLMNVFVGHNDDDGEFTFASAVGAYCVRLYKRGLFVPLIVDDLFPMLRRDEWTTENRGMAVARAKECSALWVSLIEKAYAKYYGSYAEIERGFVHHALQDLTGCESERVSLLPASRGNGKKSLWARLRHYYHNGYILGAGTGDANDTDKDVRDRGIKFNATYTVYDVKEADGICLLRLRNPPGDHPEWSGDWSDKSPLWTAKMKLRFAYVDDTSDNSFYMSFDDFCNIFKSLYVCKWYNQHSWNETRHPGWWKRPTEYSEQEEEKTEEEKLTAMQRMMIEEGMASGPTPSTAPKEPKKKLSAEDREALKLKHMEGQARAAVDSSGGLPHPANPRCIVANNPQYSLKILRATDLRVSVTQTDARGQLANVTLHPFAVYICRNRDQRQPARVGYLHKENVVATTGPARRERTQHLYASLSPGLYVIMVPTHVYGLQGHFRVDLIANHPNEFLPLWPPSWVLLYEETQRKAAVDKIKQQKEAARVLAGAPPPAPRLHFNGAHIPDVHVEALDGRMLGQVALPPPKPPAAAPPAEGDAAEGSVKTGDAGGSAGAAAGGGGGGGSAGGGAEAPTAEPKVHTKKVVAVTTQQSSTLGTLFGGGKRKEVVKVAPDAAENV